MAATAVQAMQGLAAVVAIAFISHPQAHLGLRAEQVGVAVVVVVQVVVVAMQLLAILQITMGKAATVELVLFGLSMVITMVAEELAGVLHTVIQMVFNQMPAVVHPAMALPLLVVMVVVVLLFPT